jgi:hypothetical protein
LRRRKSPTTVVVGKVNIETRISPKKARRNIVQYCNNKIKTEKDFEEARRKILI